ncbi:MAG TPA: HNH endonuclease, partial [Nocardioides sp.]|uniref:HNH endonuclease signature motif containing protein n=1 Tax=Nocardioides sp. TaxID=35761 RepID=UPI002E326ED3
QHGGSATQVLVMIDYDTLCGSLADSGAHGVAQTSTGDSITAGQARRLACTAAITPVVLGGKSEILDVGRASRLFKGALRTALDLRDRNCRTEGCDIPAAWCEAHHKTPWSQGGPTSLDNGVLLCPYHHHRAHDPAYDHSSLPNGDIRYHRRP